MKYSDYAMGMTVIILIVALLVLFIVARTLTIMKNSGACEFYGGTYQGDFFTSTEMCTCEMENGGQYGVQVGVVDIGPYMQENCANFEVGVHD